MNVIMIAPGYPGEMPYFCRGLTQHGGKVYGLSDVPEQDLPPLARAHLSGYLRVPDMTDEQAVVQAVQAGVARTVSTGLSASGNRVLSWRRGCARR
jgi:hypothetical protein